VRQPADKQPGFFGRGALSGVPMESWIDLVIFGIEQVETDPSPLKAFAPCRTNIYTKGLPAYQQLSERTTTPSIPPGRRKSDAGMHRMFRQTRMRRALSRPKVWHWAMKTSIAEFRKR